MSDTNLTTEKSVFIIGPGFIGWNILDLLIAENNNNNDDDNNDNNNKSETKGKSKYKYKITALVRRDSHAEEIRRSGATPLISDLNDSTVITEQTSRHDVTIHTATADHLSSVQAVLDGVRKRASQGRETIFIHTSGTSVLDDNAMGEKKSDVVYRDDEPGRIDGVDDDAPHRRVDLAIKRVHEELGVGSGSGGKVKIGIMTPPLIYGFNPAHGRLTIQIPTLTRFALKHGYVGHIGPGLAVESNIHVLDLARAYVVLLHHLESVDLRSVATSASNTDADSLRNPYYFCETTGDEEPSWRDVASVIGEALHKAGKLSDPTPRPIPEDQWDDLFGRQFTSCVLGLNSRSRAIRLRALGWEPIEKDWKRSYVEDELPEILKEELGEFKGYAGTVAS